MVTGVNPSAICTARLTPRLRVGSLLDEHIALVAGHRIDQALTDRDGRYHSHPAVVRTTPGLELRAQVSPDALPVLFRCDGTHRLRDLVGDDPELRELVCAAARGLLAAGLLTLSPGPAG